MEDVKFQFQLGVIQPSAKKMLMQSARRRAKEKYGDYTSILTNLTLRKIFEYLINLIDFLSAIYPIQV